MPGAASPADASVGDAAASQVVLAAVAGAHGLGGEVRLKLFTDDLVAYPVVSAGGRVLTIAAVRGDVARFVEIADRTAAEAMRGTLLTVGRNALPPLADDEYYHADLIGLRVEDREGVSVGTVVAIENFGAGDVIEIARPGGDRFMVPMRPEAVPHWSTERMVVDAAFVP